MYAQRTHVELDGTVEAFCTGVAQSRDMRVEMEHPSAGTNPLVSSPIKLSRTPVTYEAAPPELGQHTREVLMDVLGLAPGRIEELLGRGVIA